MTSTAGTPQATTTATPVPAQSQSTGHWLVTNGKWLAGYAALWIILEGMIEAGAPEIASGLAALIALGFTLSQGNEILDNLNKLVQGKAS